MEEYVSLERDNIFYPW